MKDLDCLPPAACGTPCPLPSLLAGPSSLSSSSPCTSLLPSATVSSAHLNKDYVYTDGGNLLHRRCLVKNDVSTEASCIVGNRSTLRGDVARISLGRHVIIEEGTVIRPPLRVVHGKVTAEPVPVMVGSYVHFGKSVVCEGVVIGHFTIIESRSVIGARATVGNGVWLMSDSVVPPNAILSPFCVYKGNPVKCVGRLVQDAHPLLVRERLVQLYASLLTHVSHPPGTSSSGSAASPSAQDRRTRPPAAAPPAATKGGEATAEASA